MPVLSTRAILWFALSIGLLTPQAMARHRAVVGAPMDAGQSIMTNVGRSGAYSALTASLESTGLSDMLSQPGPFTVFVPTNQAFDKLPRGYLDNLKRSPNRSALAAIMRYHIVAGRLTSADIVRMIKAGGGQAVLITIAGAELVATAAGSRIVLADAHGGRSIVTTANIAQSNGLIHVVDAVLIP